MRPCLPFRTALVAPTTLAEKLLQSGFESRTAPTKETPKSKIERPMKKSKLPKTDSIEELAEFWERTT